MALVTPEFNAKYRQQSAAYGAGAHVSMRAEIRRGRFNRRYAPWPGPPVAAVIAGTEGKGNPWQAFWEETTSWVDLPNVLSFDLQQQLDNNGIQVVTLEVENILEREQGSGATLFRTIERGALAPYRGYSAPGFPGWDPAMQNEWFDMLARNSQITVYQALDDEEVKVFTGLIDDIDMTSRPDRITITLRDFGQVFTDQRMFGNVKNPYLRDPVTFADRLSADDRSKVGYGATASDQDSSGKYKPAYVLDLNKSTFWRSRSYNAYNATTWVQIRVPEGRYASFYVDPKYAGMKMYVCFFAKPRTDGEPCRFGGEDVGNTWIDGGGVGDDVPGDNGGNHFVRVIENVSSDARYYEFGDGAPEIECGPGSILRLAFRDLIPINEGSQPAGEPDEGLDYRAGVNRLVAIKRQMKKEAVEKRWVLVDDAADVIRVICRWAGFKEWSIENTGVRLKRPVVFNRGDFLMDCMRKIAEAANYVFFMDDPSPDPDSIGIPTFRNPAVLYDYTPYVEFKDTELLTAISVKITDEPLAYVIRVRGRIATGDETAGTGFLIGGNSERRVKYTFYPPWSGPTHFPGGEDRLAGILKHVVHQDVKFTSEEDCKWACWYIALQEALASVTGTIEVPAHPALVLDQLVTVRDVGTGMRSRLWVAQRGVHFQAGEQATWKMTLSGTWVDTPDVVQMKNLINANVRQAS